MENDHTARAERSDGPIVDNPTQSPNEKYSLFHKLNDFSPKPGIKTKPGFIQTFSSNNLS